MDAQEFRSIREAMGMTQAALAVELDMSLRQIAALENGEARIRNTHAMSMYFLSLRTATSMKKITVVAPDVRQLVMRFAQLVIDERWL